MKCQNPLLNKYPPSFASEEEDWNNYRDEELLHDAQLEEREKLKKD